MAAVAALLACAPGLGGAATAAGADPASIPLDAFFEAPLLWAPALSPSGDALAVQMRVDGRRVLAIVDTATLKKVVVVAKFASGDVDDAQWVNDRRLVFSRTFEEETNTSHTWSGLWAVDRDGRNERLLINGERTNRGVTASFIKSHVLTADHELLATLRDGSSDVIVERDSFGPVLGTENRYHAELQYTLPMRLDTMTGETKPLVEGRMPDHPMSWVIDDQGRIQAVFASDGGDVALLMPDAGTKDWRSLMRFPAFAAASSGSISDMLAGVDGNLYVVRDGGTPEHTQALYRFDSKTGQAAPAPMVNIKGFDFDGDLVEDHCTHKVLGVHYRSDALGSAWLDPAMAAIQAKIDAQLPGRANVVDIAACAKGAPMLVTSQSDHVPKQFYLYDAEANSLRSIAQSRPAIDPRQMADTDFYRIKARDGREFPVYVTKPHGEGPWPTVVLVHGGPNVRGWSWEWDGESQFLASRGYLVVKPEFRGSAGYGGDLLQAGFRQWGLAMQDDIADATRWATAQGWSDPKRTCIAGGSYGGYAALMGLVRYPDLYRCGIARSAVADIQMMYETWWSDQSENWKSFGMPLTVGDRVKDAAQFAATSPLKLAAQIRQPLLLEHGAVDKRVPIEQATSLRSALEATHAPLTWLYYPEEGHGLWMQQDRIDFFTHEEAFLAANIGSAAAAAAGK